MICYNRGMVALPVSGAIEDLPLLRLYRRAVALWCSHVAEETGFGPAAAYASSTLPAVPEANCLIGEVPGDEWPKIREHFAAAGSQPLLWYLPKPDVPPDAMRRVPLVVHRLTTMPQGLSQTHSELTMIPARASFPHVGQIAAAMRPNLPPAQAQEAAMCHLDDSRVDAVLALHDGRAVGYASVLSTGEAGFIQEFFVLPEMRHGGYGHTLAGWILDACHRSVFKQVLWVLPQQDQNAAEFAGRLGFAPELELVMFEQA